MNRNDLRRVDLNLLIVFETLMHERSVTPVSYTHLYGAGIAILFSIFNDQLGMEKKWLATIDATLSICAII